MASARIYFLTMYSRSETMFLLAIIGTKSFAWTCRGSKEGSATALSNNWRGLKQQKSEQSHLTPSAALSTNYV